MASPEDIVAQAEELDMLRCMYPGQGEFTQESPTAFTLRFEAGRTPVRMQVSFPEGYPSTLPPRVAVLAPSISRARQTALAATVDRIVGSFEAGEAFVSSFIMELGDAPELQGGEGGDVEGAAGAGVVPPVAAEPTERTWLYFIGFYTPSIIEHFAECASGHGLTGFLTPGKPAVAALEGTPKQVAAFLRDVRVVVFATVPPSSKKMQVLHTEAGAGRQFSAFTVEPMYAAAGSHKRKDLVDIAMLQGFLKESGVGHMFELLPLGGVTEE